MRVISQNYNVDIDYERSSFGIKYDGNEYVVLAFNHNNTFIMGVYSTEEKASNALLEMSKGYNRYVITDNDGYMMISEDIDYDLDRHFNKIDISHIKNMVYIFPKDS